MRANSSTPKKVSVTVPERIDVALENLARFGLHGSNKAEVTAYILREYLTKNAAELSQLISAPLFELTQGEGDGA